MKALVLAKAAVLALALSTVACGQTYTLKGTPGAAGADGKITAKVTTANALTQLSISAEHLPPPERVLAGSSAYVVWARQDANSDWLRIAKLDYDPKTREGKVEVATVPLTGFELAITAEQQDKPKSPSTTIVFTQKVSD